MKVSKSLVILHLKVKKELFIKCIILGDRKNMYRLCIISIFIAKEGSDKSPLQAWGFVGSETCLQVSRETKRHIGDSKTMITAVIWNYVWGPETQVKFNLDH